MKENNGSLFEAFLNQHDGQSWARVLSSLLPFIHEVDRAAVQIWFAFFPVDLARAMKEAEDPEKLATELQLLGKYHLKDQIDSSHRFLYGHRFWPQVKDALTTHASSSTAPDSLDLTAQVRAVADGVSAQIRIDPSLALGITAVGFMTLQQVGFAAFSAARGEIRVSKKKLKRTPEQVLRRRTGPNGLGILGFLQGAAQTFSIVFDENDQDSQFRLIRGQELTTAAASDTRHSTHRDHRLLGSEGPIPVQCRAAACGTCWVGILGGAEKLSDVERFESTRIKDFGYIVTDEPKPLIRLACRAQAFGPVSIVIPPWNGVFGKFLRERYAAGVSDLTQR